ncbi:DEAD/DEAH box helicase [Streptomyces sp. NPDC001380]|uniref:DEAD/DEAH box helicase n=1 Tax=Streptomyces sp. NPDC001380 TaxID=3364566 RepID=UPI0036AD376A
MDTRWLPDEGLANEVDGLFERAIEAYRANPNLVVEHANHEESIRVGGYSNRTLLELVQNAADAMSGADGGGEGGGRVEIVLDLGRQVLYCANAGRPFSRNGLTAIAHAHLSGKRGDEIGRFGLGFKSVLAITGTPQVFSRSVSFGFNSPEANAAMASVGSTAKRFPVLRTATLLDARAEFEQDPVLAELAEWAVTVVRLPSASRLDSLQDEIRGFRSEFLLFVGAVREIRLRVIGGEEDFVTSHVSRDLGDGRFRIENPEGDHEEWYVENRMHESSREARAEVGEAVSRDRVKVTVAVPTRFAQLKTGEFWSYFPLQDRTSASALFNAPWSVDESRTTLLDKIYNREILATLSRMFVDILPRVSSTDDPAAHLDYMPARGREVLSYGDRILCNHVPEIASKAALVPDADGVMRMPSDLRPLDFTVADVSAREHEKWSRSPHTAGDVPHWRCYVTGQRTARLRQLCVYSASPDFADQRARDEAKALERMPKRGIRTWLREWAEGDDLESAAEALRFVLENPKVEGIRSAKVVPTTGGMRSLEDRNEVFLTGQDDIDIEGAVFVDPSFLAFRGVAKLLSERVRLRELDPVAVLEARLSKLSIDAGDEEFSKFWDAVLDVPTIAAQKVVAHDTRGRVKVPTMDGGWSRPGRVLDVDGLADGAPERRLDRKRCAPQVAHAAGVVSAPVSAYPIEDEVDFEDYRRHVLEEINRRLGPGERPVERIEFDRYQGPGPFSVLRMLEEGGASDALRQTWTIDLVASDKEGYWTCEDIDTGRTYRVVSPVRWAVQRAGWLNSTRGHRVPARVVSASLVGFEDLLPLFRGPRPVEDYLQLPKELEQVPPQLLREALGAEVFPPRVRDATVTAFVLGAASRAFPDGRPTSIPARVGNGFESRSPNTVYVATSDEERKFLHDKQKPYLLADRGQADLLVEVVGCRRFEESFSFSLLIDGRQDGEPAIDLYTGLRSTYAADKVGDVIVAKAVYLAKRTTTDDGVEDQSLDWHLDGRTFLVRAELDERRVLENLNEALALRLSNSDLRDVLQKGVDQRLEQQRQAARAAVDDAERLAVFFGDDTLKDNLPKGLWEALEAQGLVDGSTSVAELFLTVYRYDSVQHLKGQFDNEGYTDVPTTWAGGATTIAWLRKMGFGAEYAGRRDRSQENEFVVPGTARFDPLHDFQKRISRQLRDVLLLKEANGNALKGMVELPTGAGKTRVAIETVLRLFIDGSMKGPILWIAQSAELCEQAVQTFVKVWRGLEDESPLTIGRLWDNNVVHEPDTEFSVVVATDAKLDVVAGTDAYEWLSRASAVFVDEAHRAGGSKRYTKILRWLGVDGRTWKRPLVGLSATPFKGRIDEGEPTRELAARFGNRKIKAFDDNAYEELSRIEVLARVRHEVLPGVDVVLNDGEILQVQSKRRLEQGVMDRIGQDQARMRILVDHIMRQNPEWPVLVFTPSILSAQVLAATLRYRGVTAEAVSGQTGQRTRRDVIERFKRGEIRVLANCDLLVQGFDAPGVRALYIARPTFSPSAYIQMAGRGLRGPKNGGKEECLIVDVADNFGAVNDFLGYRAYEDLWLEQEA